MSKILRIVNTNNITDEKSVENLFSTENLITLSDLHTYDKCGVKKIDAASFVHGFLEMFQEGKNCLRTLCLKIGVRADNKVIKKTSLESRFNRRTFAYVVALLQQVMQTKVQDIDGKNTSNPLTNSILNKFNDVLLADSTCQALPDNLADAFPSSSNQTGKVTATARIQLIYNYTQKVFAYIDLGHYRENDQSSSDNILDVAKPGNLVIRDLGYFSLTVFMKMIQLGIFFLSRLICHVSVYDVKTEKRINLLELFKGKKEIDMLVKLGYTQKLEVRLVARKLPVHIANQRIEKARKEQKKNSNRSDDYYKLLEWEIFITNVSKEILSLAEISHLYQLRWFIEIIFKTWKSHFNFKKVLNIKGMSYYRAIITIVLMLVKITYAFTHLFIHIDNEVQKKYNKLLSPLKFLDVIDSLWTSIVNAKTLKELDFLIPQFAAHATYETRIKQTNIRIKYI